MDPACAPLYLLIVADPATVPFSFQQQMATRYHVGRIHFESLAEYETYARSVVEAETSVQRGREVLFIGVENLRDRASELSARRLVPPLAEALRAQHPTWAVNTVLGSAANRARLLSTFSETPFPMVLFVAAHGALFRGGDPRYWGMQGAIIASDYPGGPARPLRSSDLFSAADVPRSADLRGAVVVFFGSHSAGTTRYPRHELGKGSPLCSPRPIVSPLARRLLANPGGGALAFIGNVDSPTKLSFEWDLPSPQTQTYETALHALLSGRRVGAAMEPFAERYAELATELLLTGRARGAGARERRAFLRAALRDAGTFALIGDPAVYLAPTSA